MQHWLATVILVFCPWVPISLFFWSTLPLPLGRREATFFYLDRFTIAVKVLTMYMSSSWISAILPSLLVISQVSTAYLAQESTGNSVEASVPSPTISDQPSSTSSAPAQTHTIQVGLADHKFRPEATTANVGDVSWSSTTISSSFSNTQCTRYPLPST